MNARTGEEFIKAMNVKGSTETLCRRMSSPPMKSPWRCVQKGQTADGKSELSTLGKISTFLGRTTPPHSMLMRWQLETETVLYAVSPQLVFWLKSQAASQVSAAALGALAPNLIQEYELCHHILQTPSVSNETPCQTKVSTEYRPTGQTDYYTLQTFELLPCYLSASQKQPKKLLARNKNLHALVRANYAVLWEYLMNLWHDDLLPAEPHLPNSTSVRAHSNKKNHQKFKLHGASLQMPSTEEFLDTSTIKDEKIKLKATQSKTWVK